jgi:hypothetical protein
VSRPRRRPRSISGPGADGREILGGAAGGGPVVVARAGVWVAALLILALALGGCESSQERSAQLEHEAKHRVGQVASKGLQIAHVSAQVKVLATQVLHSSEGNAALVTLHNTSTHALRDVPLAITVKGAGGAVLYRNDAPGLEAALTSVPLLAPGATFTWIDDQVQVSAAPASLSAEAGEAQAASGPTPQIRLSGVHGTEEAEGPGIAGKVANDSGVAQSDLIVYGIARRGGRIVGAGRAVLSEVPAHGSSQFQVLLIGSVRGAQVQASAPPTTF